MIGAPVGEGGARPLRGGDLSPFSIAHDRQYIIPALKDPLRLNPEIRLLGSPWSAPAWMKTNGRLAGISPEEKAAGVTCKLRPDCFEAHAVAASEQRFSTVLP